MLQEMSEWFYTMSFKSIQLKTHTYVLLVCYKVITTVPVTAKYRDK